MNLRRQPSSLPVSRRHSSHRCHTRWLAFLLPLLVSACNSDEAAPITYYQDVKPIIDAKCTLCHVEGGIAPMALDSYQQARGWAPQIATEVSSGRMPPWYAGDGCNEYVGDRSLTPEQRQQLVHWAGGGALEGEPDNEAEPLPQDPNDFRVDVTLRMPEPYSPSIRPDEYRCFVLEWPLEDDAYIRGVGLRPGNAAMVHHSVVYMVAPENAEAARERDTDDPGQGYTCFSGGMTTGRLIGAIEKAEAGRVFPHDAGMLITPGSVVVIQQHYNTLSVFGGASDQSTIEFMVEDEVERPATAEWFTDPRWFFGENMRIPAGEADVTHTFQSSLLIAAGTKQIHWADLHMHQLGTRGELSLIRADGTKECLLRVDDWAFDWQETYMLKRAVTMEAGDQLYLECHFDNTQQRQIVVDGVRREPVDVAWGDRSQDEMCLGNFLISEADD